MDTTTDKTLSVTLIPKAQKVEKEQYVKDWAQYSQWIAAAMSKRTSELDMSCRWKPYVRLKNALGVEIIKKLNENKQRIK